MTALDAAGEIFAVTDVLVDQPMLRRSLSDPSAGPEQRVELARTLFGSRVGPHALETIERVVRDSWTDPRHFARGVEREGVVVALKGAAGEGSLKRVTDELHTVSRAVAGSADLTALLRSAVYDLEAKRGLVGGLLEAGHPVTKLLAERAIAGHRRTFSQTLDSYLEFAADLAEVAVAKVTVAHPLDEARLERLRAALTARVGRPVSLQVDVDPAVIGGINVSIGHDVYESTVAARLEDVRRQLINS